MINLLDDRDGKFVVLINSEGQYSLWPEPIVVPEGWDIAHPIDTRQNCLSFIESEWTDMRPKSIRQ